MPTQHSFEHGHLSASATIDEGFITLSIAAGPVLENPNQLAKFLQVVATQGRSSDRRFRVMIEVDSGGLVFASIPIGMVQRNVGNVIRKLTEAVEKQFLRRGCGLTYTVNGTGCLIKATVS